MLDRFLSKVKKTKGCWLWTGHIGSHGYGQLGRNGLAHRISWELFNGKIAKGMFVLHKCDNRRCTNPKHLFLGTQKDNVHDCLKKGRWKKARTLFCSSEEQHSAKLTNKQVQFIRSNQISSSVLGAEFGVCRQTITNIRARRTYRDVK